jgi:A/G-specific adenine glycosylase
VHAELLEWYAREGRDLPWRRTRDPWAVLVSEVMLQQTQVARVIPHYMAFLARFPDPATLAAAATAEVLAAWSGLGYNRRALALKRAAEHVASKGWPADLCNLPGAGPYTAAAVASFAFGSQEAAVDTNVRRVIERVDGRRYTPKALANRAAELLPPGRAAEWNHALMDLGATVCTARAPHCGSCPVAGCRTRGAVPAPALRGGPGRRGERFEDTDRYVRGRIVASLATGALLPGGIEPDRIERAVGGLERDGLVVRDRDGVRLP